MDEDQLTSQKKKKKKKKKTKPFPYARVMTKALLGESNNSLPVLCVLVTGIPPYNVSQRRDPKSKVWGHLTVSKLVSEPGGTRTEVSTSQDDWICDNLAPWPLFIRRLFRY
jgi:hypothetical protein